MDANVATVIAKIKPMIQPLTAQERLALIQEIAQLESAPATDSLAEEQEKWFARPKSARQKYHGEYVAILHGKVVDHDPVQKTLYLRVRKQYGSQKVLIVPADWDEPSVYTFHSPRLEAK